MTYSNQAIESLGLINIIIDKQGCISDLSEQAAELFRMKVGDNMLSACPIDFLDEHYQPYAFLDNINHKIETMSSERALTPYEFECGLSYPDRNVVWLKIHLVARESSLVLHCSDIGELVAARRLNRQLSIQDPHTGLLYREAFLTKIQEENRHGTVCCVRICNYQRINEIWGAAVANLVFMEILARAYTETNNAICSKHSTDSFIVFVPNEDSLDIEHFYSLLNEPFHFNGRHFFSNVALGYYQEKSSDEHEQSLNKAEMAILDVSAERIRLAEFQEDLAKQIEHQNNLEMEFRSAINDDLDKHFHTTFQPIHCSKTSSVVGGECLIRWVLNGNMVSPVEFIPIAEKTGDIGLLTQFNIRQLGEMVRNLESKGIDTLKYLFALNISVVEILDVDFVDKLTECIKLNGLASEQIKLELTESALIDNFNYVNLVLQQMQDLGFRVSIDDFGTGFSSLSYLCRLRFDEIKIDREFVTNVVTDNKLQTVFNSIASLATNLNKPVVAEGVETLEQLIYAQAKGIEYIQGYYFSKPLQKDDYISHLMSNQI
ncbi:bifunctional diguanylate cyclase/phosphodiesterase [Vibrio sp. 99-70-13A1]|uniref:bifunctional diguanylate cyclase/phosphodiesterase n=1 Tax=Vibrio sp. 99-70-13A1 TaxID=2607601 RepID=UPI001493D656|nr:bifunctional diguanylate cyclase/phosphodiesterase [Vibrio sp. 99-70-13A1]NOH95204.1 GGDEF domain-containing protein [Vibrio sp. 99-70-13A1]